MPEPASRRVGATEPDIQIPIGRTSQLGHTNSLRPPITVLLSRRRLLLS